MTDPYATLGTSKTASADEIKKAYRKLAKQHHPDLNPGNAAAAAKFKEISAAYDLLSDAEKRARFDRGEIDASGQERAEWVRESVAKLPETLRQTLLLAYNQDLKYREIAEILKIPVGTVKSRLHAALAKLQQMAKAANRDGNG